MPSPPIPSSRLAVFGLGILILVSGLASSPSALADASPGTDSGEVLLSLRAQAGWTDGTRVLYIQDDTLWLRDLWGNGTAVSVAPPGAGHLESPRLAGTRMAVLREEDGLLRLYVKDGLLDPSPWHAVRPAAGQLQPALTQDVVAFIDIEPQSDLWINDANGTRALTNDAASQSQPTADARTVAWVDGRNVSPGNILVSVPVPLPGEVRSPLAPPEPTQGPEPTDGIAQDAPTNAHLRHPQNLDVYVYDRRLGTTLQATTEALKQDMPTLVGERLAYRSQEGGDLRLVHRDRASPLVQPRQVVTLQPDAMVADGDRLVVWQGGDPPQLSVLRLDPDGPGAMTSMAAPDDVIGLSAGHGIAALSRIAEDGTGRIEVLRLPTALHAVVLRDPLAPGSATSSTQSNCFTVAPTGNDGVVRLLLTTQSASATDATAAAAPQELRPDANGSFHVCGPADASLRLLDDHGASAPFPLALSTSSSSSRTPSLTLPVLAALVLSVAAAASRRGRGGREPGRPSPPTP